MAIMHLQTEAIEFNLADHCNLKCSGCDHGSPHLPEKFLQLSTFQKDLQVLSTALHVEEVKLVGGEPLLHEHILDFLEVANASAICDRVTIATNGLLLHKMSRRFWELIDRIWVSVYPGIKYKVELTEFERMAKEHDVEIWIKPSSTFRMTVLNTRNEDSELVREIYERCRLAHLVSCHTVYEGRYYKCSPAPVMEQRLVQRGVELRNKESDGVAIHDNPNLRDDLSRYLRDSTPLAACSYCLGTVGKALATTQLTKIRLAAELREEHANPRELIDWGRYANPWYQSSNPFRK
jgi:MoaA/NifB/PqqE/SkfB family radical SAM enzyme